MYFSLVCMKKYLQHHPFVGGMIVFCATAVGVILFGFLLGLYVASQGCHPVGPEDPCDGPAMLIISIWSVSLLVGPVLGLLGGIITWFFLRTRYDSHHSQ